MSDKPKREISEQELERELVRALGEGGELVPTTEAEVLAAESELEEATAPLPESLREYRPRARKEPPSNVRVLTSEPRRGAPARRPWLAYAASGIVGAAAASALWLGLSPRQQGDVTSAGRDLVTPSASSSARKPVLVAQKPCQESCCAGSDCSSAPEASRNCASGQRCIACGSQAARGPYRLRFGTMVLSDAGERLLSPSTGAPLELCVVAMGGEHSCLPALTDGSSDDSWRLLDRLSSTQDLLAGLSIEIRRKGEQAVLASWKYPVTTAPEVFCKGLAIQPRQGDEVVGRVSAFVEQTHFVELGRAATVAALLAQSAEFEFSGIEPKIYETNQPQAGRFALVLGPLDKPEAEKLRWSVLDQGREAKLNYGLDFSGRPRPAP